MISPTPNPAERLYPPHGAWALCRFPDAGYSTIIAAKDIGQRMQRVWATIDTANPTDADLMIAVAEANRLARTESS